MASTPLSNRVSKLELYGGQWRVNRKYHGSANHRRNFRWGRGRSGPPLFESIKSEILPSKRGDTCRILSTIRMVITLMLIGLLTLKPDPYPNANHNPNPTYRIKPTEPYQTVP